MIKPPDLELYEEVMKICDQLKYACYDYLPGKETPYPFVYIGESQELPRATKTAIFGTVQLNVHIYGLHTERGKISKMKNELLREARQLRQTDHYRWSISNNQTQPQMLQDTSTNTPLWHAVLPLEMNFY